MEKKDNRVAIMITTGVHAIIFLVFFIVMAWRPPDPPIPLYGIELNLGNANGTGLEQPENTPIANAADEEDNLSTETTDKTAPEEEPFTDIPSPDVVKEVGEDIGHEESEEELEELIKNKKSTEGKNSSSSHGDDKDKVGDKGQKTGTIDSRSLYGSPGSMDGASLEMTGWVWDSKPKPEDTSEERGRIVFEIKIDDQGEIISVIVLEKTVSPLVEKIYRREVERLTFSRTADNAIPAPSSTGRITFTIKSR